MLIYFWYCPSYLFYFVSHAVTVKLLVSSFKPAWNRKSINSHLKGFKVRVVYRRLMSDFSLRSRWHRATQMKRTQTASSRSIVDILVLSEPRESFYSCHDLRCSSFPASVLFLLLYVSKLGQHAQQLNIDGCNLSSSPVSDAVSKVGLKTVIFICTVHSNVFGNVCWILIVHALWFRPKKGKKDTLGLFFAFGYSCSESLKQFLCPDEQLLWEWL